MWTQSSFGTWFVRVHFGSVRWSHAWVNQRGLRSGNKILPCSAQIRIVIGKAFALHVNADNSNHDPNGLFGSRSETSLGTWFVLMWTQPLVHLSEVIFQECPLDEYIEFIFQVLTPRSGKRKTSTYPMSRYWISEKNPFFLGVPLT